MKGQAFIIFRTLTSAVNARKALNEVELYGKPMVPPPLSPLPRGIALSFWTSVPRGATCIARRSLIESPPPENTLQ